MSKRSRARRASRRELARERLRACPSGKAAFPTRLGALLFASRVNIEDRSPNGVSLARAYMPHLPQVAPDQQTEQTE